MTGSSRADLARAVADVVTAVPGVACLVSGPGVEVATQYPGGKVVGVGLTDTETVTVHLVVDAFPAQDVAERAGKAARWALRRAGDQREVFITVTDVDERALSAFSDRPNAVTDGGRATPPREGVLSGSGEGVSR
jgi:hypothetical protein